MFLEYRKGEGFVMTSLGIQKGIALRDLFGDDGEFAPPASQRDTRYFYFNPARRPIRLAGALRSLGAAAPPAAPFGEFIPLVQLEGPEGDAGGQAEAGGAEAFVLERTKELNQRTRERPSGKWGLACSGEVVSEGIMGPVMAMRTALPALVAELEGWLALVRFQEEAARATSGLGSGRVAAASIAAVTEKKLAILERALEANPGDKQDHFFSQRGSSCRPCVADLTWPFPPATHDNKDHAGLVRLYMRNLAVITSADDMPKRWAQVLQKYPGRPDFWSDYLQSLGGKIGSFDTARVRAAHVAAVEDLMGARDRALEQASSIADAHLAVLLERRLVSAILAALEFDQSSGYTELFVARAQVSCCWRQCLRKAWV